jgi:hypothetical protein
MGAPIARMVKAERWIEDATGREVEVVARERSIDGDTFYCYLAPLGNEALLNCQMPSKRFERRFTKAATGEVKWHLTTRPWSFGYEDGEHFGEHLRAIREELGFETTEEFSAWLYVEGKRRYGPNYNPNLDVPPVLLDAFEFPALGAESASIVIETVAQALGVSPGTLLDELWLRCSGYSDGGDPPPEED